MATPTYTVVVDIDGNFEVKLMKDVKFLKCKGTSLFKATKIKEALCQ